MSDSFKSDQGVAETRAAFNESLRLIGKQEKGRTIGISYFTFTGLRIIPLVLRLIGFLLLFSLIFIHQPFAWLPLEGIKSPWLQAAREWEMVPIFNWAGAVFMYALYFAATLWKSGIYFGQPGVEIHFAMHQKIVRTLKSGERTLVLDPRKKPFAVVSTKPFVLNMKDVEGVTKDSLSLTYAGAFILRVINSHKLLEQGGFGKFIRQFNELYESVIKDRIQSVDAAKFNSFLITPVAVPEQVGASDSITERLRELEGTELSVELLVRLSEIDELDVSKFDLKEDTTPARRAIIERFKALADDYGIEILDHVPRGNLTSDDYLATLTLALMTSIIRLRQATETLEEIVEETIEEEINAEVAGKRLGVLEVQKIISEIESVTAILYDDASKESIVKSKQTAMENVADGLLASVTSRIESLRAQIRARSIDTTGMEQYLNEMEKVYKDLEDKLAEYVPQIRHIITGGISEGDLVPNIDVVKNLFESTGTNAVLATLEKSANATAANVDQASSMETISKGLDEVKIEEEMSRIQTALSKVSDDSGVSVSNYQPDMINMRIEEIARRADVDMSQTGTQTEPMEVQSR